MQKQIIRLLLDLDSSLVKVSDKNGRIPADIVPSSALELQDLLQAE